MDQASVNAVPISSSDDKLSSKVLTEQGQSCLRMLLRVWFEFERSLSKVPIVQRLEQNRLSIEDYQKLLLNMRQQVIEGSRWITQAASSFDRDFSDVRSEVIGHAYDEHRDYEMLERDYVASGGKLEDIQQAQRNLGSEALHGFMMYRSAQPNPIDMIGAMWIIEGLGNKMASQWADIIATLADDGDSITSFMRYHGENDEAHMAELYELIDRVCQSDEQQSAIERTAKVVGKLYLLQLEEIDNV